MSAARHDGRALLRTHLVALAGGAAAAWIGAPLPYMIGALVSVACVGMTGVPTATDRRIRDVGVVVLMTGIGLGFTPVAAAAAIDQLGLIVLAALMTVVIGCALAPLLARLARIDQRTAFFCAVPGGPAEMSLMGERHGALAAPIAISQLLRIVALVLVLPPVLTFAGVRGGGAPVGQSPEAVHAGGVIVILALSFTLSRFLRRLGVASGFLIAPMAVGAGLGLSQTSPTAMPAILMQGAQLLMGAFLGAQFQPVVMQRLRRFMPAALVSVALLTTSCAALGLALHWANGEPIPTMLLATAPGSVTEMSVTADALGVNAPLVTAYHLLRILVILLLTPIAFALMRAAGLAAQAQTGPTGSRPE